MKNKQIKKNFILLLILVISIGFAYLSSALSINGNIGYSKNSWDIYFDNIEVNENSIQADAPVIENKTTINFSCLFNQPGSFYEFTVDIVNAGTIDAMIDEITKTALSEEYSNYLEYSVTYLDGTEISKYDALPSEARLKLKVKVQYKYDIAEIPNLEEINLSTSLTYLLADENASYGHGEYWNFDYKGSEDIFTAPTNGIYLLETWGAQGGKIGDGTGRGGYGGHSSGNVQLQKNEKLFLNVGGKGEDNNSKVKSHISKGGYNGGGDAGDDGSTAWAGGGGATHIAFKSGLLLELQNSKDTIVMVAGAGGGSGWFYLFSEAYPENNGGSGGGYIGNAGTGKLYGLGGTQSSGGKFDYDKNADSATTDYNNMKNTISVGSFGTGAKYYDYNKFIVGSGGGSGLYGGGSSYTGGSSAGGGSGYIGNSLLINKAMYCYNCEESTEESTKTISTTNVSEEPISQYAKIGNGYARITYLGKN